MASVTEVLSFLRILTSNASKATPAEKGKEFDEVLLSNVERLKDALGRKGRFPQLEKHFENQSRGKELSLAFCENTVQVRDKRPTHTQNARTIFAQTRVEKRVLEHAFARKCAHLMRVFSFVIHSHQWHSSPSSLDKRQDKRQFLQTPLKIFPPTNKLPIRFWLCTWC